MPNRIKDIFSDETFSIKAHVNFGDEADRKRFFDALEAAHSDGCFVPVEGVTSIFTEINHKDTAFPLEEHTDIVCFGVGHAIDRVEVPISMGSEKKTVTLWRSEVKDGIVVRTEPTAIVNLQFNLKHCEGKLVMSYDVQFEKAQSVKDVAESFRVAAALLERVFFQGDADKPSKDAETILGIKRFFRKSAEFFTRVQSLEDVLNVSFFPDGIKGMTPEDRHDIEELYLFLVQHKIIRVNGKLTSTESKSMTADESTDAIIGKSVALTFLDVVDYAILGHTVKLFTANLVFNAIVKEIIVEDRGTTTVFYDDTDSKPMYYSRSAYLTYEEAEKELSGLMARKEEYQNAMTSNYYIEQYYV